MSGRTDRDQLTHDMRNALAVVRATIEALADGKLAPSHDRLMSLVDVVDRLDAQLTQLYELFDATAAPEEPSRIDVVKVAADQLSVLAPVAKTKDVTVVVDAANGTAVDSEFYGPAARVAQMLKHVLLITIRHASKGSKVAVQRGALGSLDFDVDDCSPQLIPDIKAIVEEQRGSIEVAPASEPGARFTVRAPGGQAR